MKYRFYSDAGHGWLAVPKAAVEKLRVVPSACSYERGNMVYLEEDCDASKFCDAFRATFGAYPLLDYVDHGDRSPIRSYNRVIPANFMCSAGI
jgi:hypothetical protein